MYTNLYTNNIVQVLLESDIMQTKLKLHYSIKYLLIASTSLLLSCVPSVKKDVSRTQDWPSFGRDYSSQRFSPANQINTNNVKNLALNWAYKSGVVGSFQTTPIVQNGVMYLSLPFNHVVALDAKTGKELWRYNHDKRADWKMCCGPANRGVAVTNGKVFIGTVDARLIALNATTGVKEWDIDVVEGAITTEGQDALNKDDPNSARKVTGGTGIGAFCRLAFASLERWSWLLRCLSFGSLFLRCSLTELPLVARVPAAGRPRLRHP